MAVVKDPEGIETAALHRMVDFTGLRVLEIGCGNGRLTWRYSAEAANVTGIDPDEEDINTAQTSTPAELRSKVSFRHSTLEDYAKAFPERNFDLAIFAWSL
jgi:2-polyprenyl-3-methyl-5-hydroxy-6-metoxy-1,4-benzoquinol methylase